MRWNRSAYVPRCREHNDPGASEGDHSVRAEQGLWATPQKWYGSVQPPWCHAHTPVGLPEEAHQHDGLATSMVCTTFVSGCNQDRADTGGENDGSRKWVFQTGLRMATVVQRRASVLLPGQLAAQLRADSSLHGQLQLLPVSFHRCSPLKTTLHPQL